MATQITDAVGAANSKGEAAKNLANDVRKIQALLKQLRISPDLPLNGKCDAKTIEAIQAAQGLFKLKQDGRVDRTGTTLKRLNGLAAAPTLAPISQVRIASGGYQVRLQSSAPPKPYQLALAFSSNPSAKLMFEPQGKDLITSTELPTLLFLIDRANLWGQTGTLKLFLLRDGKVISQSTGKTMPCPVKPYEGELTPQAIGQDTDLKIHGQWNWENSVLPWNRLQILLFLRRQVRNR